MAEDAAREQAKAAKRKEKHEYLIYQLSDTDPAKPTLVSHLQNEQRRGSLGLSGLSFGGKEKGLSVLFTYSRSHPILKLDLSNNSIRSIGAKRLAKGLRANTSMTELNLAQNKLRPRDKKILGDALFGNPRCQLKYFQCNEWSIKPEDTAVKLPDKKLGAQDFILLAGLLSKNPNIKELDLSNNHGACGDYQGSGQYDEQVDGIHALCEALFLPTSARITSLNLSGNNIKAVGCDLIAQLLDRNSELTSLDLSCNQLLMNGPSSIEIGSFEAFCEALKGNKKLRNLNLSETSLCAYRDQWRVQQRERKGVAALCDAVEANNSITELDVSRNYMGHEDVIRLSAVCGSTFNANQTTPLKLSCGNQLCKSANAVTPVKNTKLAPLNRPQTAPAPQAALNKKKKLVQSAQKA